MRVPQGCENIAPWIDGGFEREKAYRTRWTMKESEVVAVLKENSGKLISFEMNEHDYYTCYDFTRDSNV